MSRHRDVRCMNYSDEYDGYDDVYGHSVEDDYCVSPGAEQFMYDRNKQSNIASFFTEPDIIEDNEENSEDVISSSYKIPPLSELEAAKLMSCVESIKNVIGDSYPESELNRKIIEFNYNTEAVLDSILNDKAETNKKANQPTEQNLIKAQSGSKPENLSSGSSKQLIPNYTNLNIHEKLNFKQGCEKSVKKEEFSSLSDMIAKTSKPFQITPNSGSPFKTLADLTVDHLKTTEKKPNSPSNFTIPKLNFTNSKASPLRSDATSSFNSLADLTAHRLKISTENNDTTKNTVSPSGFIIPKITSKNIKSDEVNTHSFNSLSDFTAHHLKISNQHEKNTENINSTPKFMIPKINFKDEKNVKSKFSKNDDSQDITNSVIKDISKLKVEEQVITDKVLETNEKDCNLHPNINPTSTIYKNSYSNKQAVNSPELTIKMIKRECMLNMLGNNNFKLTQKSSSLFGKVLCKKYNRKIPYRRKPEIIQKPVIISRFDFSSPSPDTLILSQLSKFRTK